MVDRASGVSAVEALVRWTSSLKGGERRRGGPSVRAGINRRHGFHFRLAGRPPGYIDTWTRPAAAQTAKMLDWAA
jgi:hypothetical protein